MYNRHKQNYPPNQHRCQIDCTNHDQVIHNLESKSKDLYYFWRNYEWLYNHYYNSTQQQKNDSQQKQRLEQTVRQLQNELSRSKADKKKLQVEIETLKIQLSNSAPKMDVSQDYEREINRLKNRCGQYEAISQKRSQQIIKLKNSLNALSQNIQDQRDDYQRKYSRMKDDNINLQRTIDQLRVKMNLQVPVIQSNSEQIRNLQQKHRTEIRRLMTNMRNIQADAQRIIQQEIQGAKAQIINSLSGITNQITISDIRRLIIDSQEYQQQPQVM